MQGAVTVTFFFAVCISALYMQVVQSSHFYGDSPASGNLKKCSPPISTIDLYYNGVYSLLLCMEIVVSPSPWLYQQVGQSTQAALLFSLTSDYLHFIPPLSCCITFHSLFPLHRDTLLRYTGQPTRATLKLLAFSWSTAPPSTL